MSQDKDILLFKEEILKTVREFKDNLMRNIESKISEIKEKNEKMEQIINNITEENKKLIERITNRQMHLEKISQLEVFKNKVDSMLITHEIRINNSMEDLNSMRSKYDRAFIDNMLVPGFVGPSCQFKNIGDFIVNTIGEISKMKSEREVMKNSFKEMRTKSDSVMRTILNLTESLVKRCNDYTNAQISEIKRLLYEKIDEMTEKEKELKENMKQFEIEQKNLGLSDKLEELKEDILSNIDLRLDESKKNQEDKLYNEMNKNNTFLEKYTKNIIEDKLKEIKKDLSDLQNKLKYNKYNNLPSMPQKAQVKEEIPIRNLRKGKTNELIEINKNNINENNKEYIPNKTFSNMKSILTKKNNVMKKSMENRYLEVQKNNFDKSLENMLIEEIEKENKRKKEEIPDIVLKHKESKILLLNYNKNQQLKKYSNNLHEIKSGKNLGKKYNIINFKSLNKKDSATGDSANNTLNQKNENKNENDNKEKNNNELNNINNNNELDNTISNSNSNTILIIKNNNRYNNIDNNNLENDINNTKYNNNNSPKTPLRKRNLITEENSQNNKYNNQEINKNISNNISINIKDRIIQESKPIQNIIDELKIPQILDKRILSKEELEEMKLGTEKTRKLNKKINFKIDLNKSVSASHKSIKRNNATFSPKQAINEFKTLKDWRKHLMNKNDKNLKSTKERNINNNGYNLINLELANENYTMNGATVLANKKLLNNHITKMEMPNSFSRLYNAQVNDSQ